MKYTAVEYSRSQDAFHVDSLDHILEMNQRNAMNMEGNDYQVLAVFENYDDAGKFAQEFRKHQRRSPCLVMPLQSS